MREIGLLASLASSGRVGRLALLTATLAGIGSVAAAGTAHAVTRVEKTFGSWAVVCVEEDDGTKRCSMLQQRANQQRQVVFIWSINADAEKKLTQSLTVPAGVSIKEGVRLFLGEADPVTFPYDACGPRVCIATMPLDDIGVQTIGASEKASANYVQASKRLVQIDLDTAGFTDAMTYFRQQLP
jgi:invasion protein IalB